MNDIEKNTAEFYDELHNNCNIETLEIIANKGIFLYKPLNNYDKIKDHKSIIKFSINAFQAFYVNNIDQYNAFIDLIYNIDYIYARNFIPNEYLIKTLIFDTINIEKVDFILKSIDPVILLFYLYNYNLISKNVFRLFKPKKISDNILIKIYGFNFFYLNKKFYEIKKLLKYFTISNLVSYILKMFGNDTTVLEYVIENLINDSLIDTSGYPLFIQAVLPLNIIEKYKTKIFKPNQTYLKFSEDKYTETFINTIFNDDGLSDLYRGSVNFYSYPYNIYVNKYNINYNQLKKSNFELIKLDEVENKFNSNNRCHVDVDTDSINFENEDLFNIKGLAFDHKKNYSKVIYIKNKIKKFIDSNYSDMVDDDSYHMLQYGEDEYYRESYEEINKFFFNNLEVFPFDYEFAYYDELNLFPLIQCSLFKDLYISSDVNKFLSNPEYIASLADKYCDNKILILCIRVCYIVSLLHNNYSIHIINSLIKNTGLNIRLENNFINLIQTENFSIEQYIYLNFKDTEIINNYIKCKDDRVPWYKGFSHRKY